MNSIEKLWLHIFFGAVDGLGEFLIDLFAGGKSLDSESKPSESNQNTRSRAVAGIVGSGGGVQEQ